MRPFYAGTLKLEIQEHSTVKPKLLWDRLIGLALGLPPQREVVRSACAKLITSPSDNVPPKKQKHKKSFLSVSYHDT